MRIKTKKFELVDKGMHVSVLAELVDMGEDPTPWGETGQLIGTFEVEQLNSHGERMIVTKYFNPTYHENSNLRAAAEALLGRELTPEEIYDPGLETELLVGRSAQIKVIHATSKTSGREQARITYFLPLAKDQKSLKVSDDFVSYLERSIKWKDKNKEPFDREDRETKAAAKAWKDVTSSKGKTVKGKKAGKSSDQPTLPTNADDEVPY